MVTFDFTGKVALVTGAASGIGAVTARMFHAAGADVIATDINQQGVEALCQDLGERAVPMILDVGDSSDIRTAIADVEVRYGHLDYLVNNAGMAHLERIAAMDEHHLDEQFNILIKGPMLLTQLSIPLMSERASPAVVNIASIAAVIQAQGHAVYSAAKAALVKFTRDCAKEFGHIRTNAILPGFIETPILKVYGEGAELDKLKGTAASLVPCKRLGQPEEIASAILFLCSPAASYMSGAELIVDGGLVATNLQFM